MYYVSSDRKKNICDKLGYTAFGRADESDPTVGQHNILLDHFNNNGYNNRNWKLDKKNVPNVQLIFSNGERIVGFDRLMEQMLAEMNTEDVYKLPIVFGSGNWTAASFVMGNELWAMEHCALIKWSNNQIVEIHAYFDNAEMKKQMETIQR